MKLARRTVPVPRPHFHSHRSGSLPPQMFGLLHVTFVACLAVSEHHGTAGFAVPNVRGEVIERGGVTRMNIAWHKLNETDYVNVS